MTDEDLSDEQIDEAAHELQRVIVECGGEPTECAYDYLRGILAKLPAIRPRRCRTEPADKNGPLLREDVLQAAADACARSACVWEGFAARDAEVVIKAALAALPSRA